MNVHIRRIQPEDFLRAKAVRLRALATDPLVFTSTLEREDGRPDAFWRELSARGASGADRATFLALDGEEAIGLAVGMRDGKRGEVFGVFSVWLAPAARGRGIATRLMGALEAWAIEAGAGALELLVSDAAPDARRLYARCGFVLDERIIVSPHAAVVPERGMTKRLR